MWLMPYLGYASADPSIKGSTGEEKGEEDNEDPVKAPTVPLHQQGHPHNVEDNRTEGSPSRNPSNDRIHHTNHLQTISFAHTICVGTATK
jgi:hypothetical protein